MLKFYQYLCGTDKIQSNRMGCIAPATNSGISKVVIFQAPGGSDKGEDGHRKDTLPIANAINAIAGFHCDVLSYTDETADALFNQCKDTYAGYIPRVNPGTIPSGEDKFFDFLRKLSAHGLVGMPHPDVMIDFGSKEVLFKLAGTPLVPADTLKYGTHSDLVKHLPKTLAISERVVKQNRGSVGSGIWRVTLNHPDKYPKGQDIPLDASISCTEAVDNHTQQHTLTSFLELCKQYFVDKSNLLVDMRFLPRVVEGEIRVLLVGKTPKSIVHKVPKKGGNAFSATLFSGATYKYFKPEEFPDIINFFNKSYDIMMTKLGSPSSPLIWTGDFLLDNDENGKDKYTLNEINCSCVGFTTELSSGIQQEIAQEVVRRILHKA